MADEETLRRDIKEKIELIGPCDILIGIPSYNNSRTIGRVAQAASAGIAKYFPRHRAVLVNSDGGSQDGTPEVVHNANLDLESILVTHRVNPLNKISTPYHGIPGKGSAFRMIFQLARALNVKACAVVDSDLRSITPEWFELLLRPVLKEGYDYVAPFYHRHKYDGTITNSIVYPLTRALYGKRIRQPIGGEFGFSGDLAAHFLEQDVWDTDVARYGIDIWMTTTAIAMEANICQAYLGAKIHDPKDPGAHLSSMMAQVVGSVFTLMEQHENLWKTVQTTQPVPLFGFQYDVGLEPVSVNVTRMLKAFELGMKEFVPIWDGVLSEEVLAELRSLNPQKSSFKFPDELWVRVVFDFALAAYRKLMTKDHLLKSFTPLYLGRTASFILDTKKNSHSEVEEKIERLCLVFEKNKSDLVQQWNQSPNEGGKP